MYWVITLVSSKVIAESALSVITPTWTYDGIGCSDVMVNLLSTSICAAAAIMPLEIISISWTFSLVELRADSSLDGKGALSVSLYSLMKVD